MTTATDIDDAAERLAAAADTRVPCAPVRDLIGADDVLVAYRVQRQLIDSRIARGASRIGRKIGLTSAAVQHQLGVDQPDFGVLLDDMVIPDGGTVRIGRLLQPKVEGEIAFRLGADLIGDIDRVSVRRAVATAHAAIEIVDSRIAGWDIRIADTIADNASSGLFVLSEHSVDLDSFEPFQVRMTLTLNGRSVSQGNGRACLGDPLLALEWLGRKAVQLGEPLRAGELVLSGALGPMVAVSASDRVHVQISGVGEVSAVFEAGEQ